MPEMTWNVDDLLSMSTSHMQQAKQALSLSKPDYARAYQQMILARGFAEAVYLPDHGTSINDDVRIGGIMAYLNEHTEPTFAKMVNEYHAKWSREFHDDQA